MQQKIRDKQIAVTSFLIFFRIQFVAKKQVFVEASKLDFLIAQRDLHHQQHSHNKCREGVAHFITLFILLLIHSGKNSGLLLFLPDQSVACYSTYSMLLKLLSLSSLRWHLAKQ